LCKRSEPEVTPKGCERAACPPAGEAEKTPTKKLEGRAALWTAIAAVIGVILSNIISAYSARQNVLLQEQQISILKGEQYNKDQEQLNRNIASIRAELSTARDYNLKIYEKVFESLENCQKLRISVILVDSLSDIEQRNKLLSIIHSSLPIDGSLCGSASGQDQIRQSIQRSQNLVRQQAALGGQWNYGVYWCSDNTQNTSTASRVYEKLQQSSPQSITRNPLTQSQASRIFPIPKGHEIRFLENDRAQAEIVASYLKQETGETFTLLSLSPSLPKPDFLGIWVCK